MTDMLDNEMEQLLIQIKTVHVFKIPPRSSAEGYKAEGWMENHIWTGRLRVIAKGLKCEVRLEDATNGKVFAVCPVPNGKDFSKAVETVTDSSRYFVLRVENQGRYAFIGIGFNERTEAFDFNVALQDHQKFVERTLNPEPEQADDAPAKDYSLKEGESIKVNFKVKNAKGNVKAAGSGSSTGNSGTPTGSNSNDMSDFLLGGPTATSSTPSLSGGLLPPPTSNSGNRRVKSNTSSGSNSGNLTDFL